jgi:hypothetical protein
MAMIVFSNQPSRRPPVEKINSILIISHAMSDDGKGFVYRFTENEIVTNTSAQTLTITLDPRLKSGSDAYIDSFVSTHPAPIQKKTPNPDVDGRFPLGTPRVEFELRMKTHEFIFLGIIVGIIVDGEYKFILCDPQVGNGPPNGGRAATFL